MLMQSFIDKLSGTIHQSSLVVQGTLELEGEIAGTGSTNCTQTDFVMEVGSTGSVTGSGTLTNAGVHYVGGEDHADDLNLSGGYLELDGSGINNLTLTGDAAVYYSDGVSIQNVSCSESNGIPTFYGKSYTNKLHISDTISGKYAISSGYVFAGGAFVNQDLSGYIENTGKTPVLTQTFKEGDSITVGTYPSYAYKNQIGHDEGGNAASYMGWVSGSYQYPYFTFKDLQYLGDNCNYFEIFTYHNGKMDVQVVTPNSGTPTVDPSQIFLIRGIDMLAYSINEYNSSSITPGTSNTGSGILGGAGAGSLNGGSANSILNGNRQPVTPPTDPGEGGSQNPGEGEGQNPGEGGSQNPGEDEGQNPGEGGSQNPGEGGSQNPGEGGSQNPGEGGSQNPGEGEGQNPGEGEGQNPGEGNNQNRNPSQSTGTSQADGVYDIHLKITGSGTGYRLAAYYDGIELKNLGGGTVQAVMKAQLDAGWNKEDLFAVFQDEKGGLVAVKVHYDKVTGMLVFDTPVLGDFQLVCFRWEGTDYTSKAFLEALKAHMN